ncbi:hypothetical protein K9U40_00415 [Xanthobacter autotrophicus]|uniref:hypothetical protein n=1 Tax=Xanthobacter TaxID=279 RepID=UPI0024AB75F0|nr:hypothetical protein [Xanthobacter autotrophicus]MDI4662807.1 hypothetical protein [Xanthobacter autotrophicus]
MQWVFDWILKTVGGAVTRHTDPTCAKHPVRALIGALALAASVFFTMAGMHRAGWLPPMAQILSDLGWARQPPPEGEK